MVRVRSSFCVWEKGRGMPMERVRWEKARQTP